MSTHTSVPDPESGGHEPGVRDAHLAHHVGADEAALAPVWVWVFVLTAALAAGFISWGVGERMHGYYGPSREAIRSRYDFSALNREQGVADRKNSAIAFGSFGALLGLIMGASASLTRRSPKSALVTGLVGLLIGSTGGAVVGYGITPVFQRYYSDENPSLLLPLLVRGTICAMIGLTTGLAFGVGRRRSRGLPRALLGGLLGSAIGIAAFELMSAFLFPIERNDKLIPTSMLIRLLFYICVAVATAAGALVTERNQAEPARPSPDVGA
jgi:hypothetical protein